MQRIFVYFLILLASLVATATVAQAQATRTWVSGVGDDANPCSRTAPCKTFAGAISKTASGGEIDALDPGGFGAVTITKPITLDGGGGIVASILASGVNGIIVNASTGTVFLRNLSINGTSQSATPGINGIRYIGGDRLVVENCTIMGFTNNGIDVALGNNGNLDVHDTAFTTIGQNAINVNTTSGKVHASLSHVAMRGIANGVNTATLQAGVDISNSIIDGATGIGLHATAGTISAESNVLSKNAVAVQADGFGVIRLSNTSFFDNTTGIGCGGGVISSAGNNRNSAPTAGGSCAPTPGQPLAVQ